MLQLSMHSQVSSVRLLATMCYLLLYAGQGFYRKWAMLLDPEDPMSGAKGYIKCDIVTIVAGGPKKVS